MLELAEAVVAWLGKGASSRMQSESVSIHLVSPVVRGWRVRGRVSMRVSWLGCWRRKARRECRNGRMTCGCEAVEG